MTNTITFRELMSLIEKRPFSFISHRSLSELEAFISGYNFCQFADDKVNSIDEDYKKFIGKWIYAKLKTVDKQGWKDAIQAGCKDEEAFEKFFELWNEYLTHSEDAESDPEGQ